MSRKRVRLGFVWPVEALTQVTTESSSLCARQPSAPPPHGFVCFAYAQTLLLDALVSVHIALGGIFMFKKKKHAVQLQHIEGEDKKRS